MQNLSHYHLDMRQAVHCYSAQATCTQTYSNSFFWTDQLNENVDKCLAPVTPIPGMSGCAIGLASLGQYAASHSIHSSRSCLRHRLPECEIPQHAIKYDGCAVGLCQPIHFVNWNLSLSLSLSLSQAMLRQQVQIWVHEVLDSRLPDKRTKQVPKNKKLLISRGKAKSDMSDVATKLLALWRSSCASHHSWWSLPWDGCCRQRHPASQARSKMV